MSIIPVFIPNAGCPHQCIFCNQKTISGQGTNGLAAARAQIEQFAGYVKPSAKNEIAFYGGSFTALPLDFQEQLLQLAHEYMDKGLAGRIRMSTRPDYIDDMRLALLEKYGVETVELGAQSLDDKVLRLTERGHDAKAVELAVARLKKRGFVVGLQFMLGLPGQDFNSVKATLAKALELKPAMARIYPALVVKGTKMAEQYLAGTYKPLPLEEAVEQSWYMFEGLTRSGIQVIRMGLQPDEELCKPGNILAGPFHPSFGELVKSYGYRLKVKKIIAQLPEGDYTIVITHPPHLASMVRGMHKANVKVWEQGGNIKIKFQEGKEFGVIVNDRKTL